MREIVISLMELTSFQKRRSITVILYKIQNFRKFILIFNNKICRKYSLFGIFKDVRTGDYEGLKGKDRVVFFQTDVKF